MKSIIFFFILPLIHSISLSQQDINQLMEEGVAYHDKGDYDEAISKYDQVLKLDKNNLLALAEKAFTLMSLQEYKKAIKLCKKAIKNHPGHKDLKTVYVTYGNACDALGKPAQSIKVYDEGIEAFPDFYLLHFNKGITLVGQKELSKAILCFQQSARLNPRHASSHNALARMLDMKNKKTPAILAYSRFLVVEPQSARARENIRFLQEILNGNTEQKEDNTISISLDASGLGDTTADGRPKENSFRTTDMILALTAALDYSDENKDQTDVEKFIRKFEVMCSSIKEVKEKNHGFYWDYYVPYFVELKDNDLIETFAYIAFATSDESYVEAWLSAHQDEIDAFYQWSGAYAWPE